MNRHARGAKTDRIDGDKLWAMLLRQHRGDGLCSVVHETTPEDARRTNRDLTRLTQQRPAHATRVDYRPG